MNVDKLLCGEIRDELSELKKMEVGSESYKVTVDGITKLVDRAIELEKIDIESQERAETREFEKEARLKEMKNEERDRLIKNLLTGVGLVVTTGVTIWGTLASFKFEESGTVTTIIGRGFINKLLPKK